MLLLVRESVIASGNSSFQENLDLETTNLYTNHLLDLWFTRKTKNMIPFLSISLAFTKSEISAGFFSEMVSSFGDLSGILSKSIFSSYCFIWLYAKKVKTRNFASFFQLFAFFSKIEKSQHFSASPFSLFLAPLPPPRLRSRGWLGIFIVRRTQPRKCYCERSSTLAHGKL